jgi:hypothetical protein
MFVRDMTLTAWRIAPCPSKQPSESVRLLPHVQNMPDTNSCDNGHGANTTDNADGYVVIFSFAFGVVIQIDTRILMWTPSVNTGSDVKNLVIEHIWWCPLLLHPWTMYPRPMNQCLVILHRWWWVLLDVLPATAVGCARIQLWRTGVTNFDIVSDR